MTKGISWRDDAHWQVTTTEADIGDFHPYCIGNGRIGVRVGPLMLDWNGDRKPLHCENGHDYWGRLNSRLLVTLAKHVYEGGNQLILPAWNQPGLTVGGVEYCEGNGRHRLRNVLDLRTGEAACEDIWEYQPGRIVKLKIRLVVPRSHASASWYEIGLSGLADPAVLRFGLNASQVAEDYSGMEFQRHEGVLVGSYEGRRQGRIFAQGLRWEGAGWNEESFERKESQIWETISTKSREVRFVAVQSVHSSTEGADPASRVHFVLGQLDEAGRREAAGENEEAWKAIWCTALDFRHRERRWERMVLLNQFHLLTSLEEDGEYPLGPLGLSRPGWHGSQMWDADFWLFRALLPLWPGLARSIVRFRRAMLPAARANAEKQGLRGAFYPWLSTDEGSDMAPPMYRKEIHNNVWIGLAAWEAASVLQDEVFLQKTTWPILEGVANFFVSRASRDQDGNWHLRGVLPPDESVAEAKWSPTGTCDDNVLTNVGARTVLRRAIETAALIGAKAPAEWAEVADRLVVLPPGPDGVIPEYAGYRGHKIKQADTILAFYPLQLDPGEEVLAKTLAYYHERTDRGGPLMTVQIEALLKMRTGDREHELEFLFREYSRYVRGPHFIPYETPENANSIMLTGIGGLLQALIFGWYGAELDRLDDVPRIGDSWAEANESNAEVLALDEV